MQFQPQMQTLDLDQQVKAGTFFVSALHEQPLLGIARGGDANQAATFIALNFPDSSGATVRHVNVLANSPITVFNGLRIILDASSIVFFRSNGLPPSALCHNDGRLAIAAAVPDNDVVLIDLTDGNAARWDSSKCLSFQRWRAVVPVGDGTFQPIWEQTVRNK